MLWSLLPLFLFCAFQAQAARQRSLVDLTQNPSRVLRVYGDAEGDQFGGASASDGTVFGDVNGDGFDDIIISAMKADTPGGIEAGEIYVIYGGPETDGRATMDMHTASATVVSQWGETRILGAELGDSVGLALASADFNHDGFDDIALGAPALYSSFGLRKAAGQVYIIYGYADLPGVVIDLSDNTRKPDIADTHIFGGDKDTAHAVLGVGDGDKLGWALASANVNGDEYEDLLVSAFLSSPEGRFEAGKVFIFYGGENLPGAQINLDTPGGQVSTWGETRILGDLPGDTIGYGLAAGDMDGDGIDEVVIGARTLAPADVKLAKVIILKGGANLAASIIDLRASTSQTTIHGGELDYFHGSAVALGDLNADGFDDLLMGAHQESPGGEAYVLFGMSDLGGKVFQMDTSQPASSEVAYFHTAPSHDHAASSVAAGDVNGDGFDDLILGNYLGDGADPVGQKDAGSVSVIFGSLALPGSKTNLTTGGDILVLGDELGGGMGGNCQAGADVNQDGIGDYASSAQRATSLAGAVDAGYLATFFGSADSATTATVREFFPPGETRRQGMGGRLSPTVRTQLSFSGGDNGSGKASLSVVSIKRGLTGISNLGGKTPENVADVVWKLTTNRVNFSMASVTFQYLEAEVAHGEGESLYLYRSESLAGPWAVVSNQSLNASRHEISGSVAELGYFTILRGPAPASVPNWSRFGE